MKYLLAPFAFLLLVSSSHAATKNYSLTYNGTVRTYAVHTPPSCSMTFPPVVLVLHGLGGTGNDIENRSGFSRLADKTCFVAVYPNAYNGSWDLVHDVGFLSTVLTNVSYDPNRLYVVGYSQGGGMAESFVCSRPATAFSVVSQVVPQYIANHCPGAITPAMFMHGTDDPISPYLGDADSLSTFASAKFWADKFGETLESAPPIPIRLDNNLTYNATVMLSKSVAFYSLSYGGHPFPSSRPARYNTSMGHTVVSIGSASVDPGAQVIWDWMKQFTK